MLTLILASVASAATPIDLHDVVAIAPARRFADYRDAGALAKDLSDMDTTALGAAFSTWVDGSGDETELAVVAVDDDKLGMVTLLITPETCRGGLTQGCYEGYAVSMAVQVTDSWSTCSSIYQASVVWEPGKSGRLEKTGSVKVAATADDRGWVVDTAVSMLGEATVLTTGTFDDTDVQAFDGEDLAFDLSIVVSLTGAGFSLGGPVGAVIGAGAGVLIVAGIDAVSGDTPSGEDQDCPDDSGSSGGGGSSEGGGGNVS